METNSISNFFKPYTDYIKKILSNPKSIGVDMKYTKEDFDKNIELVKSAFNNELIDLNEYNQKINIIKSDYDTINEKSQSYADAIIRDSKGAILLLRRAITDDFHPDCWSLPGGKIENNESPSNAVIREVKEETNLKVKSPTLLLEKKIKGGSIFYFKCEVDDLSNIILDNDEHISYEFKTEEDYSQMNLILDLNQTLNDIEVAEYNNRDVKLDLFPTFGDDKSKYSNIIEEIANIHPISKDIFMLTLFSEGGIDVDDYVDYIEKAHKDDTHKDKLIKLNGKDTNKVNVVKWTSKDELKKLAKHAKNASHKDLETAIKESAHPQLREHAHKEIKRRESEEKIQEEKDGYEGHEYHGKDFKYSSKDNKHLDEDGNEANPAKLYQYYDQRHKEQDNQLKQLNADLDGSIKQKQALGNKLKTAYYQKINKTRFAGDEESCYKTAISKLEKMGMTEVDIEPVKIKKIISKKLNIKKSEDIEVVGENASDKAKRLINEFENNK
jgi:8-oxo-dGTP pyrophosphatase MutT (NUDIX family)